jgi:GNAT superfamily N-acetyltransferase
MSDAVVALERAEIDAFTDLYQAASPEVAEAAGLAVSPVGDAVVLRASRIDVLALNRTLGLGLQEPVSDRLLANVVSMLADSGSARFFIPVAPVNGHDKLQDTLVSRGIRHYNNWVRLSRTMNDIPTDTPTDLDVRQIDGNCAGIFGEIVAAAFGYPPSLAALPGQAVGRSGWRHYLAYAGQTPVAAAAMYVSGEAAWFGFAATDAAYRKKGAQRALVIRRLRDAAALGCSRVSVETAEDGVLKDAPSFRNLRRLGFETVYTRPNFIWIRP